ncbi:MAG: phosphocholine cytidylyltransferase family protein [Solirubrobacterales bacterium]|nr:phosphocholine cytidylyltransferase family protein [Solirubrobacterales bacterium]
MPELPVIYLAAGRGSRLGDLTADQPKAVVEVGGRPLADRAFAYLRAAGFDRIVVLTGHAAEAFDDYDVETIFNDRWETENNITSLWQARGIVAGGCTIVNCDLLFEPELAQRLADTKGTAILVDDVLQVDEESMKATETDGGLDRLHKSIPLATSIGEYIGLTRIDPADGPRLAEILDEFIAAGNTQVYYEDAIEALSEERCVRLERIGGAKWVEIDDHDDLARARDEIAPAIDGKAAVSG